MGYYKGCPNCPEGLRIATPREALLIKSQTCPYCGNDMVPDPEEGLSQLVGMFEEWKER